MSQNLSQLLISQLGQLADSYSRIVQKCKEYGSLPFKYNLGVDVRHSAIFTDDEQTPIPARMLATSAGERLATTSE